MGAILRLAEIRIDLTTDGSGDASVEASRSTIGRLFAIDLQIANLGGSANTTITVIAPGIADTLLTISADNTSKTYYPRVPAHDAAGADVTFDGTNEIYEMPLIHGKPKVVIDTGGATKTAVATLYIFE